MKTNIKQMITYKILRNPLYYLAKFVLRSCLKIIQYDYAILYLK